MNFQKICYVGSFFICTGGVQVVIMCNKMFFVRDIV